MSLPVIKHCPGTLAEGFNTYSPTCLKHLFNGRKVSPVLPYYAAPDSEAHADLLLANRRRISISGVQEKFSLVLDGRQLRLTEAGEQGQYILKPVTSQLKRADQVPANEHLTMQIAKQVYGIATAENALVFFKGGEPAYLVKRFDLKDDGSKLGTEDFASLAGKTSENAGPDFKYDYSYEEMGELVVKFVPAYLIALEKLFALIVFNYLCSNGDAHLKNFSLLETPSGDYTLSPAYDLVNTKLHVSDTDFALSRGLFKDSYRSAYSRSSGHACLKDFQVLGDRLGIKPERRDKLLAPFLLRQSAVEQLIQRSFLSEAAKRAYLLHYQTKRNHLDRMI